MDSYELIAVGGSRVRGCEVIAIGGSRVREVIAIGGASHG